MSERKGGFWSDFHDYSARTRRRNERRVRQREANRKPENFGKINWRAYTHRQLWDMVKSAEPGRMATRTYEWKKLAEEVDQATADVRRIVQTLVLSWRGPSAVAAAESASRLTEWGADASQRAYQVGTGLDAYTSAVEEAARAMPEPVHPDAERWFREGYDVTTLDGPQGAYMLKQLLDDHMPSKEEQKAAMERAVRVMDEYEHASGEVKRELPTFDEAPVVAQQPSAAVYAGPTTPPQVVPPQYPPPDSRVPADPHLPPGLPPTGPDPVPPPGTRLPDGTTTAAAAGNPGFGTPGFGPSGGFGGFGPTGGGAHGVPGGGPGGFGPLGSGPLGSGPLGSGPLGSGQPGPGGASGVLGAVPGGAAARGGFGPVAGAGGPQGFGVYPPVAPTNREEDGEHRNRYDQGLDLLDDLPPAYPPVLGE
ncbi:PPE domain-containing protein [Saccharothrix syringae]|uniref:PPE domain-containing protein n=1 Tax=Saccharothrix syringae TaxID=103733 RepID=A0A5Q0H8X9_SACSY|nr:PPE domain-containing protein [Saccharothrix syringae]QFZ22122.1 PPE domain-containing protein [Saccharothrix syringae]